MKTVVPVLLLVGLAAPGAQAVELLPHRAVYELSLLDQAGRGGMTDVYGGLFMEWRESCEGWLNRQQLAFVAEVADGPNVSYDVRFSSLETPGDGAMRFFVRSFDDGKLVDDFKGEASMAADGGRAVYEQPEGLEVALPAGTLFPSAHMRHLIESAERGDLMMSNEVFDGSGPDALNMISAVIGEAAPQTGRPAVQGRKSWPVSLAYFSIPPVNDLPDSEVSFFMTERGVLFDIKLDYGDFALSGKLKKIDLLEDPECP